jgi:hypothetical protein
MMNPFEMVVAIVIVSAIASVLRAKYGVTRKHRRDRFAERFDPAQQSDPDAERMREEIKVLKERIAVLERITTETNSAVSLDREIEKLR